MAARVAQQISASEVRLALRADTGRFAFSDNWDTIKKNIGNIEGKTSIATVYVFMDKNNFGAAITTGTDIDKVTVGEPMKFETTRDSPVCIQDMLGVYSDAAAKPFKSIPMGWNDTVLGRVISSQAKNGSSYRYDSFRAYTKSHHGKLSQLPVLANVVVFCFVNIIGKGSELEVYYPGSYNPSLDFIPIYMYKTTNNEDSATLTFHLLNPKCVTPIQLANSVSKFFIDATNPQQDKKL